MTLNGDGTFDVKRTNTDLDDIVAASNIEFIADDTADASPAVGDGVIVHFNKAPDTGDVTPFFFKQSGNANFVPFVSSATVKLASPTTNFSDDEIGLHADVRTYFKLSEKIDARSPEATEIFINK